MWLRPKIEWLSDVRKLALMLYQLSYLVVVGSNPTSEYYYNDEQMD